MAGHSTLENWIQLFRDQNIWLKGEACAEVKALTSDSRQIQEQPGSVFFARKGVSQDGHEFLDQIKDKKNLLAVVVEQPPENFSKPVIVVRDTTQAMAIAAKDYFKDPSAKAFTVAVTGTNGKTTSTFLVQALLNQKSYRTAVSGTVKTSFEGHEVVSSLTTPDFLKIQELFSNLEAKGANAFVFEASSHAIDQRRILGIDLDVCLFTNLSPEHLDYHASMEDYYLAKKRLFSDFLAKSPKSRRLAIVPEDESYGSRLIGELQGEKALDLVSWGFQENSGQRHLFVKRWETNLDGSSFEVVLPGGKTQNFHSKLVGRFNIENLMGMISLGWALDFKPTELQKAIDSVSAIPGRLERVDVPSAGHVFVDYAHTPDALENVLMALRPLTKGRLRVVFGCGGDRDQSKRPKMGAIAELHADELFITSDNPRTEDPQKIIAQIAEGLQRLKPTQIEADRETSIRESLKDLQEGDVVLVAGKGHETYQILGNRTISFDDREVVRLAFQ